MTQQTCSITGQTFTVSETEKKFLGNISFSFEGKQFKIPFPTLCPDERTRLRNMHRNEQFLYKNTSAFSQKPIISIYAPDKNRKIVSREEWFSDSWDAIEHGRNFDFSRNFFEQFAELQKEIPRAGTVTLGNENCEFTTGTAYCKNCYLINSSENCEDCYYSKLLQRCSNVVDSAYCYDSELLYECFNVKGGYDCKWVYDSQTVNNCWFCDDVRNCRNCFLCINLAGKEYHFLNQKLSKEEYEKKLDQILENPRNFLEAKKRFEELRKNRWCKYANIVNCENCTGDFLSNDQNCIDCYDVTDSQDSMYVQVGVQIKDCIDCSNMYLKPELSYSTLGTIGTFNCHFCLYVFHSSDLLYCEQCFSCKNCFGCVGLRNKEYCIFNKQYSKEEYEKKVAEIILHMESRNEWGQFFPSWLAPFPYNRSVANDYLPLDKNSAEKRGYKWEEEKTENFLPQDYKIPEKIEEVPDDICQKILACEVSGKNYRIQPAELKFYRQMNLPLPQKHPDVRYYERMTLRNPRKLWKRKCILSGKEILSPYPPDRPEKILCEDEYLKKMS